MAHTFTNLLTHIIFGTKERQPLITTELRPPLHAYLGGIVRESGGKPFAIGGTTDHVHLLIGSSPLDVPRRVLELFAKAQHHV